MRHAGKAILLSFLLLCMAAPAWSAGPQPPGQPRQQTREKENVLVGRISVIDGELLRYVPEQKDWVVTVKDSPFGLEDALYAGENTKAEFLMPNSTWIRIGANTQLQMIALKPDATEVDVSAGMARFIDRGSKVVVKATTPFGYVVGEPGSAFDVYVGDESVEVIAIRGDVAFIHDADGSRYDVTPGSMSILADARQATAGDGKVDAAWDEWNSTRDSMLAQAIETKGESVKYLPEGIQEDSQALDQNGRWERVYYQGQYRDVWRPTTVAADWEPYTVGRWTDWYGDYTWIPDEPFGYVTGHYGYWFNANNYWYWAPPVVSVGVGLPYWGIGFSWYPGRVGWLYSGVSVGWFPLLPWEPYYATRWWGPWGFAAYNVNVINININRYAYANRAVIVNRTNFTTVNNYNSVRQTVNRTTLSQFRGAPVANRALGTAANSPNRFQFTNRQPTRTPGSNVTSRVAQNQTRFRQTAGQVNGSNIRQQASTARVSRPGSGQVSTPRLTSTAGRTGAAGQAGTMKQNARTPSTTSLNSAMSAGRHGQAGNAAGAASIQQRGRGTAQGTAGGGRTGSLQQSGRQGGRQQVGTSSSRSSRTAVSGQNRRTPQGPSAQGLSRRANPPQSQFGRNRAEQARSGQFRGSQSGRSQKFQSSPQARGLQNSGRSASQRVQRPSAGASPRMGGSAPRMSGTSPRMSGGAPRMGGGAPHIGGGAPRGQQGGFHAPQGGGGPGGGGRRNER